LIKLFQKFARWRARSPLALRRERNSFDRRFSFCQAFSFAPFSPKEKAESKNSSYVTAFVSWIKVLIKLFQKFARWRARSPPRSPQRAKLLISAFFFLPSFFFCALFAKRKSGIKRFALRNGFRQLDKVLIKLFQKFARWRARSPPRSPQRAKLL